MNDNKKTPQKLRPGEVGHIEWLKKMREEYTDHDSKEYRVLSYALNLISEYEELKKALTWLTPMGSDFTESEECLAYIKERLKERDEYRKEMVRKDRDLAKKELKIKELEAKPDNVKRFDYGNKSVKDLLKSEGQLKIKQEELFNRIEDLKQESRKFQQEVAKYKLRVEELENKLKIIEEETKAEDYIE